MQISSSMNYNIGLNYAIKLNEKEMLVYENDPQQKNIDSKNQKIKNGDTTQNIDKLQEEKNDKKLPKDDLSQDEQRLVRDLESRDSEVRTHELAHQSAGGGMVGGASFTYQQGPDGKMYAIGGEVSISTGGGSTPEESMRKARQVIASAMAPSNPSGQDFAVASSARMMEMRASQQLAKERLQDGLAQSSYQKANDEDIPLFDISA